MRAVAFSLLLAPLLVSACVTEQIAETPPETERVEAAPVEAPAEAPVPTAPPAPPSFAAAIELNLPQGIVEGAAQVQPLASSTSQADFSAATDYAAQADSFSLLIWSKGALVHEQYFEPHTSETRAESASMHKSVLALAVGAALDDGLLTSVDDPIGTYIPEWQDDPRGAITIENLLQMSSGLKPLSYEGGPTSEALRFNNGENVRETLLGLDLIKTPGDGFHYTNTVSQLLGLILERATGQPYETYLSEKIWQPLGAAEAYVWYNEPEGFPRTYSALLARPLDWLRVGLLIKNHGLASGEQIVSADYIEAMTSPSENNPNYGYQIWLGTAFEPTRYYNDAKAGFGVMASEPFATDDMIYFDGFGGQRVYISRRLDLVIVRTGEIRVDWDDTKLPNLVIGALADQTL